MSVAALTPSHFRRKRAFEPSEASDFGLHAHSRRRLSPGDASSGAFAALRALFPDMDDKVVLEVLAGCGNDVEEAVKQLGQLRLTASSHTPPRGSPFRSSPVRFPQGAPDAPGEVQQQGQQPQAVPTAAPAAAAAAPQGAPQGMQLPSPQQQSQPTQQQQPSQPQRSTGEWAEALVEHMQRARDLTEARAVAVSLLGAFGASLRQDRGGEGARAAELARDNAILKRAVAIQNTRLQEVVAGKEAAVAELRGLLEQYQHKVQSLEVANYSLAVHLRQAAGADQAPDSHFRRPPDVY